MNELAEATEKTRANDTDLTPLNNEKAELFTKWHSGNTPIRPSPFRIRRVHLTEQTKKKPHRLY